MAKISFPNESQAYRDARDKLLNAEAQLRDAVDKVAAERQQLPLGGRVKEDYVFDRITTSGTIEKVKLSELFGDKDTLFLYGYMYGPEMEKACPMCTSFLDGLNGNAVHLKQRIAVATVGRSPIERLVAIAKARGWNELPVLSSENNSYQSDYHAENAEGAQMPMANVFVKKDDGVYHYWGSELLYAMVEGRDPRHMDTMWPLWNVLDTTPEGRGGKWYPSLSYE